MSTPGATEIEVRALLEARLHELDEEAAQIRIVLASLDNNDAARAGLPPTRRLGQVLSFLREHPAARAVDVARGCGVSQSRAHQVLAELLEAGAIVKQSKRYSLA